MARQPAPCGTKTAYERHLRRKEVPCEPCTEANAEHVRQIRAEARKPSPEHAPKPVEMPSEASRLADLEWTRETLRAAIQWASAEDPARVNSLVKEFRAVWEDIEALKPDVKEADPFSDFFDADNVTRLPSSKAS